MRRGWAAVWIWVVLSALAVLIVVRARYSADLSAFLPRTPSASERLLVEQLQRGVAARMIIAAIGGTDPAMRAQLSQALSARLSADPDFVSVENGAASIARRDRAFLFEHRYLLSPSVDPQRFTVRGLHTAIGDSLALLASPIGLLAQSLLPSDPTGEMAGLLEQLSRNRPPRSLDGVWVSPDGALALLLARTRAAGADTDGQQRAIDSLRRAFAASEARLHTRATLQITGPGVFAVRARANIKQQVMRLSLVSGGLIFCLLLLTYRSLPALVLALLPVATGALAGVAAVALRFGVVQGVTLGFGVTLIGEAVDYSIYLIVQSRTPPAQFAAGARPLAAAGAQAGADTESRAQRRWQRTVWPTVRLGMLTSVVGFASLLPSSFPGLAQLGLYSLAGVLAAGLLTRFVLPRLLPARLAIRNLTPLGERALRLLRHIRPARIAVALIAALSVLVIYWHRDHLWNRQLEALSPVPAAAQRLDATLRSDLRAPDVRYLVVVSAPTRQGALRGAEQAGQQLAALVRRQAIGSYESPARYLPSLALQQRRRMSLPAPGVLRKRVAQALVGLPIAPATLTPFIQAVAAARSAPLLTRQDLDGTSFAAVVDALLTRDGPQWQALLPLTAPATGAHAFEIDIQAVRAALSVAGPAQVTVLDLKGEANALYSTYLREAVRLSLAGLAAIVVLLLIALRDVRRTARVVLPLLLAVLAVAAGLSALGVRLTLLHVIGMLLIVAVGSNYALFFDRPSESPSLTLASLLIANASTVLGFGVLAFSSVPVLADLGSVVAPGALLALIFAAILARAPAAGAR